MSSFQYTIFSRSFSTESPIFPNISKHYEKIKQHIISLIKEEKKKENKENERIFVNIMIVKIVFEIITHGYIFLSDENILEKLNKITLNHIVKKGFEWIDNYKLCRCGFFICVNRLSPDTNKEYLLNILREFICKYGIFPTCKILFLSYQYFIQEKRVASLEELREY